eukprot:COSAG01_NODE_15629_length_1317_cov_17.584565_1_plen_110_part_10
MINPIISTHTRKARYQPARDSCTGPPSRHSARSARTRCVGGALRRRQPRRRRTCGQSRLGARLTRRWTDLPQRPRGPRQVCARAIATIVHPPAAAAAKRASRQRGHRGKG